MAVLASLRPSTRSTPGYSTGLVLIQKESRAQRDGCTALPGLIGAVAPAPGPGVRPGSPAKNPHPRAGIPHVPARDIQHSRLAVAHAPPIRHAICKSSRLLTWVLGSPSRCQMEIFRARTTRPQRSFASIRKRNHASRTGRVTAYAMATYAMAADAVFVATALLLLGITGSIVAQAPPPSPRGFVRVPSPPLRWISRPFRIHRHSGRFPPISSPNAPWSWLPRRSWRALTSASSWN